MLDDLKHRDVKFQSLTEAIDTETPTGRVMWQMIGVLAELERSLITERTRGGVKDARRRGEGETHTRPADPCAQTDRSRPNANQGREADA